MSEFHNDVLYLLNEIYLLIEFYIQENLEVCLELETNGFFIHNGGYLYTSRYVDIRNLVQYPNWPTLSMDLEKFRDWRVRQNTYYSPDDFQQPLEIFILVHGSNGRNIVEFFKEIDKEEIDELVDKIKNFKRMNTKKLSKNLG